MVSCVIRDKGTKTPAVKNLTPHSLCMQHIDNWERDQVVFKVFTVVKNMNMEQRCAHMVPAVRVHAVVDGTRVSISQKDLDLQSQLPWRVTNWGFISLTVLCFFLTTQITWLSNGLNSSAQNGLVFLLKLSAYGKSFVKFLGSWKSFLRRIIHVLQFAG